MTFYQGDICTCICIKILFIIYIHVVTATTEFSTGTCPNSCSYLPQESVHIDCASPNDLRLVIQPHVKHLLFENCIESNLPTLVYASNVRSVTIKYCDFQRIDLLLKPMEHLKCMKIEVRRVKLIVNHKSILYHLHSLEYLEMIDSYMNYNEVSTVLQFDERRNPATPLSLVLGWKAISENDEINGRLRLNFTDIFSSLLHVNVTCLAFNKSKDITFLNPDNTMRETLFKKLTIIRLMSCDKCDFHTSFDNGLFYFKELKAFEYSNMPYIKLSCRNIFLISSAEKKSKFDLLHIAHSDRILLTEKCQGGLYLYSKMITSLLPKLEDVSIRHTRVTYKSCENKHLQCYLIEDLALKRLDLSNVFSKENENHLEAVIYGLNNLIDLNLFGNELHSFPEIFFYFMPQLETLLLGNNRLGNFLENDYGGKLFLRLKSLKIIDMSRNAIKTLPKNILVGLTRLERIDLTGNKLFTFEVFISLMNQLQLVVLKQNSIESFSQNTQQMFNEMSNDRKQNNITLTLDLTSNDLKCQCKNISFIEWFQNTDIIFTHKDNYSCVNQDGHNVIMNKIDLKVFDKTCNPLPVKLLSVIIVSIITPGVIILCMILYYRKRHLIRYWCFRRFHLKKRQENNNENYQYDVYVSYSDNERPWALGELKQVLENQYGLKLCLKDRDFLGGTYITDNILEGIETSRKTLLIISPDYVESNWCQFEMNMAFSKLVLDGENLVVPVLYKPLYNRHLNRTMAHILDNMRQIEWNSEDKELFWEHLSASVGQNESRTCTI